ncbi:MAG: hypothetical protein E7295_13095 [Lachnospiraceae bacterium]|jgi:hypothetical protein|nr:hypothetical protein [Lachnospiraceae bacterium]
MKFKRIKLKIALPMLLLTLLTGCGQGQGTVSNSAGTNEEVTISSVLAESDQTPSNQESEQPKSETDLLLDIEDKEKRFTEAEKLLAGKITNIEDGLENNLRILRIMAECKSEESDEVFLDDDEFNGVKNRVLEAVEKHNGKSAILFFDLDGWFPEEGFLSIYDNRDRLTYANNSLEWDKENHYNYEAFKPDYSTEAYRYLQDSSYQYDGAGRLTTITVHLTDYQHDEPFERIDRATYDDEGKLINVYHGDDLYEEYKYNANGNCISDKVRRLEDPAKDDWYTTEYQYGKDGFLQKATDRYFVEYEEKKLIADTYEYDASEKYKAVYVPARIVLLTDQLGKRLCPQKSVGGGASEACTMLKYDVIRSYEKFGGIDIVGDEAPEDELTEDESTEEAYDLLPKYYCERGRAYMIGVTKDHGNGFVEYVQYELTYHGEKLHDVVCMHALYYLPGRF